jgi:undecaprenyl diphosphate synthase
VLKAIEEAEAKTAQLTGGQVILCFNYGGQREIADAVKKVIQDGVPAEQVTPELISSYLYAPDVPPCDLIVRTSGELRLSNFLLWRAAYSELMFLDKLWPDMTRADVTAILEEYQRRSRRFGK